MAVSFLNRRLTGLLLFLLLTGSAFAQLEDVLPMVRSDTPIVIDADSSDFDYSSSKLVFRGLRMTQGMLGVKADYAETDKLDFDDGLWTFTGNVEFTTADTTLVCDWAEIKFINHELAAARMTGEPAWFKQIDPASGTTNSGEAKSIVYRLSDGILELRDEANFTDGSNKVAGDLISYDLQGQSLRAGAGSSGPVKIYIEPPSKNKEDE